MSAVCVLAPVVISAWPSFSTAIISAAATLGYSVAEAEAEATNAVQRSVELNMPNQATVTGALDRGQRVTVERNGVTVTFSRDIRGRPSLCVTGSKYSQEELQAQGQELSQAVIQQYVYQRIMEQVKEHDFTIVEEEVTTDRSIRLKVRQWQHA